MNYLSYLKKTKSHKDNRWVVKYDSNERIREVKLIYNPKEYKKINNRRVLLTQDELITILENDKNGKAE